MSEIGAEFDPATAIENSALLTELFGYWPDFHDAEILDLLLSVGCAKPWLPGCESPILELKARLCDWNGTNARTLVEMKFRSVQKIELSNFGYQNSVSEIVFSVASRQLPDGRGGLSVPHKFLSVEVFANCGVAAKFESESAEVVSAKIIVNEEHVDA